MDKPEKDEDLRVLNEDIQRLDPDGAKETINKFNELVQRKINLSERILKLNLLIEQGKNNIENLERELGSLHSQKEEYQDNKEAIENLEGFLEEKKN